MTVEFREAVLADVPAIVALLTDDVLGQGREGADMSPYLAAFDRVAGEPGNQVIVGEEGGRIVATYQITAISGLSLGATRRAQIEAVRVASDQRGEGVGRAMFADAEARAREAGCGLLQLTMNVVRTDSAEFHKALGFEASHVGFKKPLAVPR